MCVHNAAWGASYHGEYDGLLVVLAHGREDIRREQRTRTRKSNEHSWLYLQIAIG